MFISVFDPANLFPWSSGGVSSGVPPKFISSWRSTKGASPPLERDKVYDSSNSQSESEKHSHQRHTFDGETSTTSTKGTARTPLPKKPKNPTTPPLSHWTAPFTLVCFLLVWLPRSASPFLLFFLPRPLATNC